MSVLVVASTPNTPAAPDSAPRRIARGFDSIEIDVVYFRRDGFVAVPYLWVREVPSETFETVLTDEPNILDFELLDAGDTGSFYKVRWEVDSPLIHCLLDTDGLVLEANGSADEWNLKLWFEDNDQASIFQRCCGESGVPLHIQRLTSIDGELSGSPDNLTDEQRETLLLAFERGHYEEPRLASQRDLAEELDVSTNAVSRLLRRGYQNLIQETLIE